MRRRDSEVGLFEEAEALQRERHPQFDLLYSLQGFLFCDLILAPAEGAAWQCSSGFQPESRRQGADATIALDEAERRATQTLEWMIQYKMSMSTSTSTSTTSPSPSTSTSTTAPASSATRPHSSTSTATAAHRRTRRCRSGGGCLVECLTFPNSTSLNQRISAKHDCDTGFQPVKNRQDADVTIRI